MPSTKPQILAALALLPLDKLEILEAYANFLIVPQEDLLTNVTMSQMRAKVFELADIHFPEWTDRSPSDFGVFLSELFCVFSEKDFWYINGFAQQALLSKMSLYSSAFIRATELGYRPIVYRASEGSFQLVFPAGSSYVYAPGEVILEVGDGTRFTNTSILSVPTSAGIYTVTTTFKEGIYNRESVSFNGRSIDIRKAKVDIDTVTVSVDGIPYSRVAVFGNSGSNSTHFMILPEEDGKCSVYFGEDGYGKKPDLNTPIEIFYLTTQGVTGNVAVAATTVKKQSTSRPLSSATLQADSTLGINASTLPELKYLTTNFSNYRKACINEDATYKWLLEQPEVGNGFITMAGTICYYFFKNKSGIAPTLLEQSAIQNRLTPLLSNGFTCTYAATTMVNVSPLALDLSYLIGYDEANIVSLAKQIIQDYTDALVSAEYGKDFDLTELNLLIRTRVPGVQNVVFTTVAGGSPATISVPFNQMLDKIALVDITVNPIAI